MIYESIETILVATDFSLESRIALNQAITIAQRCNSQIVLLWVEGPGSKAPSAAGHTTATEQMERLFDDLRAEAAQSLQEFAERARTHNLRVDTHAKVGHADEIIVQVAEEIDADLIVTGTKGLTGFKRFILGSVAEKVVRMSNTNVLVARGELQQFTRILVPTDFSPASEKALQLAVALGGKDAEIDLLHAWQYPPGTHGLSDPNPADGPLAVVRSHIMDNNTQQGKIWIERYAGTGAAIRFVQKFGTAASVIHEHLDNHTYDLVSMGTHGYRGFRRFLLGSVAEATVRHASCSVLVAHAKDVMAPETLPLTADALSPTSA